MDDGQMSAKFPEDIQETLDKLMVNRRGKDPQSYMKTESIVAMYHRNNVIVWIPIA